MNVLWMGDSIAWGVGTYRESWPSRLCRIVGADLDNKAVGGSTLAYSDPARTDLTCWMTRSDSGRMPEDNSAPVYAVRVIDRAIEAGKRPDLVVMSGGINDAMAYGEGQIGPALTDAMIHIARNAAARGIAFACSTLLPIRQGKVYSADLIGIIEARRRAANAALRRTFAGAGMLLDLADAGDPDNDGWLDLLCDNGDPDGLHPGDIGAQLIAERGAAIWPHLRRSL